MAQETSSALDEAARSDTLTRERAPTDTSGRRVTLLDVQDAFESGEYQSAIELSEEILAADTLSVSPDAPGAHVWRGRSYAALGQPDSALTAYDRALNEDPFFADAYAYRAEVLTRQDRISDAVQAIEEAVELAPNNLRYRERFAALLMEVEAYREAIPAFTNVLERRPDAYSAVLGRARAHYALDDFEKAYYDAQRAIKLDSNTAVPYRIKADALFDTRQFKLAVDAYTELIGRLRAMQAPPERLALAFTSRSQSHVGVGTFQQAVQDATQAITLDPSLAYAYRTRAIAHGNLEQNDAFCRDLQTALDRGFTQKHGPEVRDLYDEYCSATQK